MSWNGGEHKVLLRNHGVGSDGVPRFADVGMAVGADEVRDGRGMALVDFDRDGDLDIVLNHNPGDNDLPQLAEAVLLRNDLGQRRSWLVVELVGAGRNRDAIGAQVSLETSSGRQLRLITAGSGYASQHTRRAHFGLGDAETVEHLTVLWPNGITSEFRDLPVRRMIRVRESAPGTGGEIEIVELPGALQPAG